MDRGVHYVARAHAPGLNTGLRQRHHAAIPPRPKLDGDLERELLTSTSSVSYPARRASSVTRCSAFARGKPPCPGDNIDRSTDLPVLTTFLSLHGNVSTAADVGSNCTFAAGASPDSEDTCLRVSQVYFVFVFVFLHTVYTVPGTGVFTTCTRTASCVLWGTLP